MSDANQLIAAEAFVNRIIEINQRHGMGVCSADARSRAIAHVGAWGEQLVAPVKSGPNCHQA